MARIQELQNQIDQTQYWDAEATAFEIRYFGDEVCLHYDGDENLYWEITFLTCYRVQYETDAIWRTIPHVKDMTRPQKCYYCQRIDVFPSKTEGGFIDVEMDLSIMDIQITCKDIVVTQKQR